MPIKLVGPFEMVPSQLGISPELVTTKEAESPEEATLHTKQKYQNIIALVRADFKRFYPPPTCGLCWYWADESNQDECRRCPAYVECSGGDHNSLYREFDRAFTQWRYHGGDPQAVIDACQAVIDYLDNDFERR